MTGDLRWQKRREDQRRDDIGELRGIALGLANAMNMERLINEILDGWESGSMSDTRLKYSLCGAVLDFLAYEQGLLHILHLLLLEAKWDEEGYPWDEEPLPPSADVFPEDQADGVAAIYAATTGVE